MPLRRLFGWIIAFGCIGLSTYGLARFGRHVFRDWYQPASVRKSADKTAAETTVPPPPDIPVETRSCRDKKNSNVTYFLLQDYGWRAVYESDEGKCAQVTTRIERTTDGGCNWESTGEIRESVVDELVFNSESNGWALGRTPAKCEYLPDVGGHEPQHLFTTEDGGHTWKRALDSSSLTGIFFHSDRTGFALSQDEEGHPALVTTENAGRSWSKVDAHTLAVESGLSDKDFLKAYRDKEGLRESLTCSAVPRSGNSSEREVVPKGKSETEEGFQANPRCEYEEGDDYEASYEVPRGTGLGGEMVLARQRPLRPCERPSLKQELGTAIVPGTGTKWVVGLRDSPDYSGYVLLYTEDGGLEWKMHRLPEHPYGGITMLSKQRGWLWSNDGHLFGTKEGPERVEEIMAPKNLVAVSAAKNKSDSILLAISRAPKSLSGQIWVSSVEHIRWSRYPGPQKGTKTDEKAKDRASIVQKALLALPQKILEHSKIAVGTYAPQDSPIELRTSIDTYGRLYGHWFSDQAMDVDGALTLDGGKSWQRRGIYPGGWTTAPFILPEHRGLACNKDGAWRSDDGGHVWRLVVDQFEGNGCRSIVFANAKHGWMVVGPDTTNTNSKGEMVYGGQRYYVTDDGGTTWKNCGETHAGYHSVPRFLSSTLAFATGRTTGGSPPLLVSKDGGCTWIENSNLPPFTVLDSPDLRRLWKGVYKLSAFDLAISDDGGETWSDIGPMPYGMSFYVLDDNRGWVISPVSRWDEWDRGKSTWRAWIFKTNDGGHSWYPVPYHEIKQWFGLAREEYEKSFKWNEGKLFRALALQAPPEQLPEEARPVRRRQCSSVARLFKTPGFQVTVEDANPQRLIHGPIPGEVIDDDHAWLKGAKQPPRWANYEDLAQYHFYTTDSGGKTWKRFLLGLDLSPNWTMHFSDPDSGWLCDSTGFYHTPNGGLEWWPVNAKGTIISCRQLRFFDSEHGWFSTGTRPGRDKRGLAAIGHTGAPEGIRNYMTNDGGATWLACGPPLSAPLEVVEFISATEAWAVQEHSAGRWWDGETYPSSRILHTVDGGCTWTSLGDEGLKLRPLSLSILNGQEVWLLGAWKRGHNGPILLYSNDGGLHWAERETNTMLAAQGGGLHFFSQDLALLIPYNAGYISQISEDAGHHWTNISAKDFREGYGVAARWEDDVEAWNPAGLLHMLMTSEFERRQHK